MKLYTYTNKNVYEVWGVFYRSVVSTETNPISQTVMVDCRYEVYNHRHKLSKGHSGTSALCLEFLWIWKYYLVIHSSYLFIYFMSYFSLLGRIILWYTLLQSKAFKKQNWLDENAFCELFSCFNLFTDVYTYALPNPMVVWIEPRTLYLLGKHFYHWVNP